MGRKIQTKHRTFTRLTFNLNKSLMIFHRTLHNGQTNTRALIFVARMEALEKLEDLVGILGVEADAVVCDVDHLEFRKRIAGWNFVMMRNGNHGSAIRRLEFDRVAENIQKHLA